MAINWFPGHMHKARKEIAEMIPQTDLLIEVVDARIPFSSENPLVPQLRGDTPLLKILNKSDLADPAITERWIAQIESEQGVRAIALTQQNPEQVRGILNLCRDMVPGRNLDRNPLNAVILGIPNVGKSTLINTLADRIIAKTGNVPAVTKAQQRIKLPNNIILHDTPGFLWPKLEPEACGLRLAVTGAIKDSIIEFDEIAMFAAEYLLQAYPEQLIERYDLDELPGSDLELMDAIGQRRGCLRKGGIADLHKVSEILLNEFRSGQLGRLTLETPETAEQDKVEIEKAAELRAKKAEKKAEEKLERRKRSRKNRR